MPLRTNPNLRRVVAPPIDEARSWIARIDPDGERPLLDLSQAVPAYPPDQSLRDHLVQRLGHPETAFYTDILGMPELRTALAAHLGEDYGAAIDPASVAITAGCNEAFCVALSALAGAGDEVVLATPYYFNHRMWLDMQGIRTVPLPCEVGARMHPDPGRLEELIGARTRAVVLISPNNPTGAEYPPDLVDAFFEVARRNGIALVIDETYKDFRAEGAAPPHRLFSRPDWGETLVHLFSFSKSYSLTGFRVGSLSCGPLLMAQVVKILDTVTICAPRIGQDAALYALAHLRDWRQAKAAQMAARVEALKAAFAQSNSGFRLISIGAYFAYVQHPLAGTSSRAVAERLAREQHILCLPGSMFGDGQEAFLRLAFANLDAELMPQVVDRLRAGAP